jgi:hypothetical protein
MLFLADRLEMAIWQSKICLGFRQLPQLLSVGLFQGCEAVMALEVPPLYTKSTPRTNLLVIWACDKMVVHLFAQQLNLRAKGTDVTLREAPVHVIEGLLVSHIYCLLKAAIHTFKSEIAEKHLLKLVYRSK